MEYYYGQAWVMGKTEVHIREFVFIEIMMPTQFSLRSRTAENLQHELRLKLGGEFPSFGH